ncbi:MAG: carboxylating nicotinate-nucleotide diphosphorylase [Victivallales bacterium]|nr:carboxylating nicotinate-nucleotide diphosphorylase [Victivallales bacterium]
MTDKFLPKLDWRRIDILIELAFSEDVKKGDATSLSVIPNGLKTKAEFVTRENCVAAGLQVAEAVFKKLDSETVFKFEVSDGDLLQAGDVMAVVEGNAQLILTAERTALNFLQRLCGVATTAHRYVTALPPNSKTKILDTRKTTPGWRNLEKYAVAAGGALNHRSGLFDRIMIKDNHRELAGLEGEKGIARSVERSRIMFPELEVEVEADSIEEVKEAAEAKADYILLDNMTNEQIAEAVQINNGRSKLEASGGITLEKVTEIGNLNVDFISVGALTHSVKAVDISLEI